MKTIFLIPVGFIFILLSLVSCEKDTSAIGGGTAFDTIHVYDTVRIHDTIRIHDTVAPVPLTRLQMLTEKTWRFDFTNEIISGIYSQYYLGGANTTGVNYDVMRFKFNTDGSGTLTDQVGTNYPFSWHFTTPDERSLSLSTAFRTDLWQMVELSGNYLHGSSQVILSGNPNNMEAFRLIKIP